MLSKTKEINNSNSNEDDNNITALVGNWISAIGTVLCAISSTPSTQLSDQTLTNFNILGNLLGSAGSAIAAQLEDSLIFIVGDLLQALGGLAVVAGILEENEDVSGLLEMQGGLLQIVGAGVAFASQGEPTNFLQIYNIGAILQLVGALIQMFADTNTQEGIKLNAFGAWTQVVGAIITALATD